MMRLWNESVYVAILIHPKKESMIYHTRDEHANYYAKYMVLHIEITIISSKYFCIRFFDSFVGFVLIHLIDWLVFNTNFSSISAISWRVYLIEANYYKRNVH